MLLASHTMPNYDGLILLAAVLFGIPVIIAGLLGVRRRTCSTIQKSLAVCLGVVAGLTVECFIGFFVLVTNFSTATTILTIPLATLAIAIPSIYTSFRISRWVATRLENV